MYTTHTKLNFLYKNINIDLQNSGVFWPRKGTLKFFFCSSEMGEMGFI